MEKYYLGIDIGTTIAKGVVINSEGEVVAEYQTAHNYGKAKDYAYIWWDEVVEIIKNITKMVPGERIDSITISAMAPNLIFLDKKGNIAEATRLFTDDFAIDIQKNLDEIDGSKWKNETLSKLIKVKAQSQCWAQISTILTTHSYIAYKMSGVTYCDIPTAFEYGYVFNDKLLDWDANILSMYDMSKDVFPKLVSPTENLGKILPHIADELGVSRDTYIIAGSHDSIASMVGAGLHNAGEIFIYYGTFNCSALLNDNIINVLTGTISRSPVEWTASIPGAGPQVSQMCSIFSGGENEYEDFDKKVSNSLPGANGIMFFSHDDLLNTGIGSKPNGCFMNITIDSTCNDMCRAVYESFPYALNAFWKEQSDLTNHGECFIAGGGARSLTRVQIVSDVLNILQYKLKNSENAVGTALIGLSSYSIEEYISVQNSRRSKAKCYSPNECVDRRIYDRMMDCYFQFLKGKNVLSK